jgi:hypothetical protein
MYKLIRLLLLVWCIIPQTVNGFTEEIKVFFINGTSGKAYFISIQPIYSIGQGIVVYDSMLTPVLNSQSWIYSSTSRRDTLRLGAGYQIRGANQGVDFLFYYGLYHVQLYDSLNVVYVEGYLDTRDCNYGYSLDGILNGVDGYDSQDFHLTLNIATGDLSLRNLAIGSGLNKPYGSTHSIWDAAQKPQYTHLFKNFQMTSSTNVNVKIGSNYYFVPESGALQIPLGTNSYQVQVPNQWVSSYVYPYTYKYFWHWENGQHFDTTRAISTSANLTQLHASYMAALQYAGVSGPTGFDHKMPLTYQASIYWGGPPWTQYEYFWYIKYDFNNVWQYTGGLPSKTVVPSADPGYSFFIKCYVKDNLLGIGMWSNTMRVWYTGGSCEECPVAYQGEGQFEPSPADANADESVVYTGSWYPVNPDTLSAKQKFDLLWPIRETVWQIKHRFRWSNSDPSTVIDDSNETFVQLSNLIEQEGLRKRKQAQETKYIGSSEDDVTASDADQNQDGLTKSNRSQIESWEPVLALHANYPNPFNPTTSIRFSLPSDGFVELSIFNVQGQLVRRLISGFRSAGEHDATWDSRNNEGLVVASGIYLYRLKFGNQVLTRKLTLVK